MQECGDKNCPIHGNLRVRGSVLTGVVVSKKTKNTVTVERHYLHYVPKYERYERRKSKIHAHLPQCMQKEVNVGDTVVIGECRKISRGKAFVVVSKK